MQQGVNIMAKAQSNIVILGLTGAIVAQLANHKASSKNVRSVEKRAFYDYPFVTKPQKTDADAVCAATAYADFAKTHEVYLNKAIETGATAYTIALADWFGAPKVLEINVDSWTGGIGQAIRVKARANVMVAHVSVVIRDINENVLEIGEAVQSGPGSAWWNYTTKSFVKMEPFPIVEATAWDLPGHSDSFAIS
jgi:hypothetical protein